jgi:hypothetical protein
MREADVMKTSTKMRLIDTVVGAILGLAVGAIAAVNVVITAGLDRGYQSSFSEIFEESIFLGVVTVAILAAGPVSGVIVARRIRKRTNQ